MKAPPCAKLFEQHYWPRFADDHLPNLKVSAVVSIADKLDTLVGVISIGKKPAGNKDPFGLRRAAIAIVRLLIHFGLSIDVKSLIKAAQTSYEGAIPDLTADIEDFIMQRARGVLVEDLAHEAKDKAVNFAEGVFSVGAPDLLDVFARGQTLLAMQKEHPEQFDALALAFKRASNIVKKAAGEKINLTAEMEGLLITPSEQALLKLVHLTKASLKQGTKKPEGLVALRASYRDIFGHITNLKPKLDAFFDTTMVMVDDEALRTARLSLLAEIKSIADNIADFTHL